MYSQFHIVLLATSHELVSIKKVVTVHIGTNKINLLRTIYIVKNIESALK